MEQVMRGQLLGVNSRRSVDAGKIVNHVLTGGPNGGPVEPGALVTYQELRDLIGRSVQGEGHHVWEAARERLRKDHKIVFEAIRGTGVRRLSDSENVRKTPEKARKRIRRVARSSIKTMAAVDESKLTNQELVEKHTHEGMMGIISHVASSLTAKTLAPMVQNTQGLPSLGKLLEELKK